MPDDAPVMNTTLGELDMGRAFSGAGPRRLRQHEQLRWAGECSKVEDNVVRVGAPARSNRSRRSKALGPREPRARPKAALLRREFDLRRMAMNEQTPDTARTAS